MLLELELLCRCISHLSGEFTEIDTEVKQQTFIFEGIVMFH